MRQLKLALVILILTGCQGYERQTVVQSVTGSQVITCLNSHSGLILTPQVKQSIYLCLGAP